MSRSDGHILDVANNITYRNNLGFDKKYLKFISKIILFVVCDYIVMTGIIIYNLPDSFFANSNYHDTFLQCRIVPPNQVQS